MTAAAYTKFDPRTLFRDESGLPANPAKVAKRPGGREREQTAPLARLAALAGGRLKPKISSRHLNSGPTSKKNVPPLLSTMVVRRVLGPKRWLGSIRTGRRPMCRRGVGCASLTTVVVSSTAAGRRARRPRAGDHWTCSVATASDRSSGITTDYFGWSTAGLLSNCTGIGP